MNLLEHMADGAWMRFRDDPLPGWCSRRATAFDVRSAPLDEGLVPVTTALCSVPFDSTASTRPGSRYAPAAIRQASLAYSSQASSRGKVRLRNMRTGRVLEARAFEMVDCGDLHVYPTDPGRQVRATAAEVFHIAQQCEEVVVIGGEHLITYAAFAGVQAVGAARGRRTGLLQIDHHFDFGDTSPLHGLYYHGSNARRISELPDMSLEAMCFVGVGDLTSESQLDYLSNAGAVIRSMRDIGRRGFDTCLHEALTDLSGVCDQVYVSVDIDACDSSAASGTGHVTVGGISAAELLMLPTILHEYPVVALDIVEVNPALDPSGATAHLAARLLFEWLFLREPTTGDRQLQRRSTSTTA